MSSRALVLLVSLAFLPTSAATWYAHGTHEPDNGLDDPTFMWFDAPESAADRVYFNAYTSIEDVVNPNVGMLGSDIEPTGSEAHLAVLGRWVDCNDDGYIGMAETALREYDARLLLDDSRCRASDGAAGSWNGEPNYRGWVTELIPIAGRGSRNSGDARLYRDPAAMVWGDYGTPNYEFARGTCPARPFPTGTTRTTGGFLDYTDCRVSQVLGDENDLASNYNGALRESGDPLALRLPDDERWNAPGHVLNQNTFGSSASEDAIVEVQDCEGDYIHQWGDLGVAALNDFDHRGIRSPDTDPDHLNPFGTVPATLNATTEGAPLPQQTGGGNSANCDPNDDHGDEFYSGFGLVEGEHPGIPTNPKTKANFNFNLSVTTRGAVPLGVLKTGASGASSDGGIEAFESVCQVCEASEWVADWQPLKPGLQLVRGNVFTQDVGIAPAYYITYYAYVGRVTTETLKLRIPGGAGEYGSATCGDRESGVHDGWNCDAAAWNFNLDGSPMNEYAPLARVGMPYNLRDVDCYDGTVVKTSFGDAGIGAASYGDDPCAPLD